jgi:hypothetical protein
MIRILRMSLIYETDKSSERIAHLEPLVYGPRRPGILSKETGPEATHQ